MSVTTGQVNTALTSQATVNITPSNATGVTKTYALSGASGGLSIDSTGKLTGTPTASGICTITATVKGNAGSPQYPTATVSINPASVSGTQTVKSAATNTK